MNFLPANFPTHLVPSSAAKGPDVLACDNPAFIMKGLLTCRFAQNTQKQIFEFIKKEKASDTCPQMTGVVAGCREDVKTSACSDALLLETLWDENVERNYNKVET